MAYEHEQREFDLYDLEDDSLWRLVREGRAEVQRRERERKLQQRGYNTRKASGLPRIQVPIQVPQRRDGRDKEDDNKWQTFRDWCWRTWGRDLDPEVDARLLARAVLDAFQVSRVLRLFVKGRVEAHWRGTPGENRMYMYFLSIVFKETNCFHAGFDPIYGRMWASDQIISTSGLIEPLPEEDDWGLI